MKLIIQYVQRGVRKSTVRDDVTVEDIVDAFDKLDWVEMVGSSREANLSAPTLTVVREIEREQLCISAYKDRGQIKFTGESATPAEDNGWFGFMKKLDVEILNCKSLTKNQARLAVSNFTNQHYDFLRQLFAQKATELKAEHTKA